VCIVGITSHYRGQILVRFGLILVPYPEDGLPLHSNSRAATNFSFKSRLRLRDTSTNVNFIGGELHTDSQPKLLKWRRKWHLELPHNSVSGGINRSAAVRSRPCSSAAGNIESLAILHNGNLCSALVPRHPYTCLRHSLRTFNAHTHHSNASMSCIFQK